MLIKHFTCAWNLPGTGEEGEEFTGLCIMRAIVNCRVWVHLELCCTAQYASPARSLNISYVIFSWFSAFIDFVSIKIGKCEFCLFHTAAEASIDRAEGVNVFRWEIEYVQGAIEWMNVIEREGLEKAERNREREREKRKVKMIAILILIEYVMGWLTSKLFNKNIYYHSVCRRRKNWFMVRSVKIMLCNRGEAHWNTRLQLNTLRWV